MEYQKCPIIERGKAHYSIINPEVVICDLECCPYNNQKIINWEAEEIKICNGKIKKDLTDKIDSD